MLGSELGINRNCKLRLSVHGKVPHECSVSLFYEDVAHFVFVSPVESVQSHVLGDAKENLQRRKPVIIGSKDKESVAIIVERNSTIDATLHY